MDLIQFLKMYGVVLGGQWSYYRGGLVAKAVLLPEWSCYQGGLVARVVLLPGWSCCQGGLVTRVVLLPGWSCCQGGLVTRVVLLPRWSLNGVSCPLFAPLALICVLSVCEGSELFLSGNLLTRLMCCPANLFMFTTELLA